MVQGKQGPLGELERVSVFGLGRVGLVMAVCLAKHGYRVVGIDPDATVISRLERNEAPFYEPQLQDYLAQGLENKNFTATQNPAVNAQSDIAYIAVGTPSQPDGSIDLSYVEQAAKMIGQSLRAAEQYQLIVVKSTVTPGTARNLVKPTVERESGKILGMNFSLCSNPEFLREGNALHDTEIPDRIIIGSDDLEAIKKLEDFYREFHGDKFPPIIRTDFENAELTKYANNAFLATKVSFINCIATIAERVPHADVKSIAAGIGWDQRIGSQFLNAGLGWGGSCFPKDLGALLSFSKKLGYSAELIVAAIETNNEQARKAVHFAKQVLGSLEGKRVSILGLAFKPQTDDMREAVSVAVINSMLQEGASITAWDPEAMDNARQIFGGKIKFARNALECLDQADCCILVTEWREFRSLRPHVFVQRMRRPFVIDGRRLFDVNEFRGGGIQLLAIGLGPEGEAVRTLHDVS